MSNVADLNSKLLIEIGRGKIGILREMTQQLQKLAGEPPPPLQESAQRNESGNDKGSSSAR